MVDTSLASSRHDLVALARQYFIAANEVSEANLVRKIQLAQGHAACFATGRHDCAEATCRWRTQCPLQAA